MLARLGDRSVSASLLGFPVGIKPRPGDHVAVALRPEKVADAGQTDPPFLALPLCSWIVGRPTAFGGAHSVGATELTASAEVTRAANTGTVIAVCVMDSSLPQKQVMFTRPI